MPVTFWQWCWFTFFVFGTFGGWLFIGILIWLLRAERPHERIRLYDPVSEPDPFSDGAEADGRPEESGRPDPGTGSAIAAPAASA
jgi:hypothetical protein